MHQTVGGGIGVVDYDLDGWQDLYFAQSAGPAFGHAESESNQLFRNLGGEAFERVASLAGVGDLGYGQGVAAADLNQDGFADLIVANIGRTFTTSTTATARFGAISFLRPSLQVSGQHRSPVET